MIIFISLPLSIGINVLANSIWTMFYSPSEIGGNILKVMAFSALFGNMYMIVSSLCQSVNKYKEARNMLVTELIEKKRDGGELALNAALDVPIMLLYNKIGIPTYLGSLTASIVGYTISAVTGLLMLRKDYKYSYRGAFNNALKTLIPGLTMLIILSIINYFLPFSDFKRSTALVKIIIDVLVGAPVYIGLSFKIGLIDEIVGRRMFNQVIRKITFGKIKLKDVD